MTRLAKENDSKDHTIRTRMASSAFNVQQDEP